MDTEKALDKTSVSSDNGVDIATHKPETGILARLLALEARLDARLGVEAEAITRKRAEDKHYVPWHQQLNMMFIWASGSMNTSCFAIGFLGHDLGLTLRQSVVITLFATLLGGAATGFAATFGAPTGLRQISISRYSFGWWPTKIIAFLNTIQQIGWAAVACIAGGLALEAVADGHLSLVVGIVIIVCVSTVISFVGLRAVLLYERYAWFVFFVIFIIIFAEAGKYTDNSTATTLEGAKLAGSVLTLLAIVYGSSASWQVIASDYYVHYPVDVNRWKVFILTTLGVAVPTSIGMCAGIVVSFGLNNRPDWNTVYRTQGLGFLVQTVLHPHGFAKFILTLLVLSGINTNVISIYSASISCQQFARPLARIPRIIWVIFSFAAILGLAIGGRAKLSTYLQNFLSLLGYWCTQYFVITCSEHVIFRKMNFANYDLEAWNDPSRLPLGLAAGAAFGLGTVAWVMGMVQTWFVGPLAKQIGGGGDIGNEFTLVITALIYIPARVLERRFIGR